MSELREGLARALCEAWIRRSGIRLGGWDEMGEIEANDFRGDADAALAYLDSRHAEFVRAVFRHSQADGFPNSALRTIRDLCDAELAKEQSK